MRQSSLFSGIIYIFLGVLFTYFAIQHVQQDGWGFFSYTLILLATLDIGGGIRAISFHFQAKSKQKK